LVSGKIRNVGALVSGRAESVGGLVFPVDVTPPPGPVLPAWITHAWEIESLSTLSDGDPVSSWTDGVSSVAMTDGGVTTRRPAYIANAGDPYLLFDGTSDFLTATTISSSQPNTILLLVSDHATSSTRAFYDGVTTREHMYQASGSVNVFAGTIVNVGAIRNARRILGAVYNGASSIYVDGATNTTISPSPGANALGQFRIGANNGGGAYYIGRIRAAYLALGHAATLGELAAMQAYVVEKYGAVA
jgi:hypothetical protein